MSGDGQEVRCRTKTGHAAATTLREPEEGSKVATSSAVRVTAKDTIDVCERKKGRHFGSKHRNQCAFGVAADALIDERGRNYDSSTSVYERK